jgi:transposase
MRKYYSKDFREMILKKLDDGKSKLSLEREFKISSRTIYDWEKIREKDGRTAPIEFEDRKYRGTRARAKIQDLNKFREFIDKNPGKSSPILTKIWNDENIISVSASTIKKTLRLISYTYKKKLHFTNKDAMKKEKSF